MWISGGTGDTQGLPGEETDSESPEQDLLVEHEVEEVLPVLRGAGDRWLP